MPGNKSTTSQLRKIMETSRGRSYTIVIVTALLILVLVFFAILPAISSILLQLNQNEARVLALRTIDQKRDNLRSLIRDHNADLPVAVGLDESLPFELNQDEIIEDMINFASKNFVKLQSVRFVNFEGRSRITQELVDPSASLVDGVVVNITVGGERGALRSFVNDVETSRRVYSINTASISKVENKDEQFEFPLILNLQVEVFFWNINKFSEL